MDEEEYTPINIERYRQETEVAILSLGGNPKGPSLEVEARIAQRQWKIEEKVNK